MSSSRKSKKEFYGGRIKMTVEKAVELALTDPAVHSDAKGGDYSTLHRRLASIIPGYGSREACHNCSRSMQIDVFTADYSDAKLLLLMADEVRKRFDTGLPFTEANNVRVQDLDTTLAIKCRTTQCRYLGLLQQSPKFRNKGIWLITGWGWKLLRGDSVPKTARYWDGRFLDRGGESTTLGEMLRTRNDPHNYNPSDWTDFGGYIQEEGPLLDKIARQ